MPVDTLYLWVFQAHRLFLQQKWKYRLLSSLTLKPAIQGDVKDCLAIRRLKSFQSLHLHHLLRRFDIV